MGVESERGEPLFESSPKCNGFYAQVASQEGAETILTIDDDFDQFKNVSAELILTPDEFATLNEYVGY